MKTNTRWLVSFVSIVALCFVGCAAGSKLFPQSGTPPNAVVGVNTNVQATLDTIEKVNEAVPTPFSPLVKLGIGLVSTALGGWAAWQTNRANSAVKSTDTIIRTIEATPNNEPLKLAVERQSFRDGTAAHIAARVKKVT